MFAGSLSVHGSNRNVLLQSDQKNRSTIVKIGKRRLQMVGRGKMIPDKDETEIGLPARHYLSSDASFVLLVDDLEAGRSDYIQEIFDRYRRALDTILTRSQSRRSSVHFLVNMLEAYYFADSRAVNSMLNTDLDDYEGTCIPDLT